MDFLANYWRDIVSVAGLAVSVVGLAITIWFAYRAKTAAEQARQAAEQARQHVLALGTVEDLSTAITMLHEIMRLQRIESWQTIRNIILERYSTVRSHLVRCEEGIGINEVQLSISMANARLGIIMEVMESARA